MPWPEDALSDGETIVTSFRPHWKLLFIPFVWFVGIIVVLGLSGAFLPGKVTLWVAVVVAIASLYLVVRPLVNWWFTRYVLTTERLITRVGLIAQSGVEIPLERITNVNFSQTVFERLLGAGDLLIESAGTSGQSKFANIPHPDEFQTQLCKVRERRTIELSGRGAPVEDRPPAQQDSTSRRSSKADAIRELAALRDEGLISDEEYEAKRRAFLDEL